MIAGLTWVVPMLRRSPGDDAEVADLPCTKVEAPFDSGHFHAERSGSEIRNWRADRGVPRELGGT
jgi:hypothetical protein